MRQVIAIILTIVAGLLVVGCGLPGYPDRRDSRVVIIHPEWDDSDLREDVRFALKWWKAATHDVSAGLSDSCDWDYACTMIMYGDLDEEQDGTTRRWEDVFSGHNGAYIVLRPYLPPEEQRIAVAHEIGHSFEMPHVGEEKDLMYPRTASLADKYIGPQTLKNWAITYGDNGKLEPVYESAIPTPAP